MSLTTVSLQYNRLSTVPMDLLSNTPVLETLLLDGNNITALAAGSLPVRRLSTLSLKLNLLNWVSAPDLCALTALTRLDLSQNPLQPDGIPGTCIRSALVHLVSLSLGRTLKQSRLGTAAGAAAWSSLGASVGALTQLTYLNLRRAGVDVRALDWMQGLRNLRYLALQGNFLTGLAPSSLRPFTALTFLNLSSNPLADLPAGLFSSLSSLQVLDLSSANLTSLPGALFGTLPALTLLDLSDNPLVDAGGGGPAVVTDPGSGGSPLRPNGTNGSVGGGGGGGGGGGSGGSFGLFGGALRGLTSLQSLHMRRMGLRTLPDLAFAGLSSLADLRLSGNRLGPMSGSPFSGLSSLTALWVDGVGLTRLSPGSLPTPPDWRLQLLVVQGNAVGTVDPAMFASDAWSNLTALDLRDNPPLSDLPPALYLPASLRTLLVSGCGLTGLGALASAGALRRLDVQGNALASLAPDALTSLLALTSLNLSGNPLTALPPAVFSNLTALQELDLSNANLSSLPLRLFSALSSLVTLNLSGNGLGSPPPGLFGGLGLLQVIDLSRNAIPVLAPYVFLSQLQLRSMDLSFNALNGTSLQPGVFAGLSSLQSLVLSNNPIQSLPFDKLFRLGLLTRFEMCECGLTTLAPLQFVSQVRLRVLALSNNSLTSMPLDETLLPALQFLRLDRNLFSNADFIPRLSLRSAGLLSLDLSFNKLVELPRRMFLVAASALRELRLQGNRLASLPASQLLAFCPSLALLYIQSNAMWQAPAPPALLALLDSLYAAGVDVQHDCVRTSSVTNGTCGPPCSTVAVLNQTAEVALPALGDGATRCDRLVTPLPCLSPCALTLRVDVGPSSLEVRCANCDAYRYWVCPSPAQECNATDVAQAQWRYVWAGRATWGSGPLVWAPYPTMGPVVVMQGLAVDVALVGPAAPANASHPDVYSFLGDPTAVDVSDAPWYPANLAAASSRGGMAPSLVVAVAVGSIVVVGVLCTAVWWHRKALAAHQEKAKTALALEARTRPDPPPPPVEVPDRTVLWSDISLLGPLAGGAQVGAWLLGLCGVLGGL